MRVSCTVRVSVRVIQVAILQAVANGPVGPAMAGPIIEPVILK